MKLHELDWDSSNKYRMNIVGVSYDVNIAHKHMFLGNGKEVTDVINAYGLSMAEFTEVVEPVDFLVAYNDCMVNKNKYVEVGGNWEISCGFKGVCISTLFNLSAYGGLALSESKWEKVV